MNVSREFKGIWIPKEIWLHKSLSLEEKVFLAEINSLDSEELEHCLDDEEYFANFSGLPKKESVKIINTLKHKGFIA
jgi:hypothetical protein